MIKKKTSADKLLALVALALFGTATAIHLQMPEKELPSTAIAATTNANTPKQEPLHYQKKKQFKLGNFDRLHRATDSHIQLRYSDKPKQKRSERINYNPVGWHNFRFKVNENGKTTKAWLFDRGHLVGYQYCGLNDEGRNLVPETSQLNKGNMRKMDSGNKNAMLYYEMHLEQWLKKHPQYSLDYQVTPLYKGNELLPRQVRLAYVGYNSKGKLIPIKFGTAKEKKGNNATVVILENISKNAIINYCNGTAKQL